MPVVNLLFNGPGLSAVFLNPDPMLLLIVFESKKIALKCFTEGELGTCSMKRSLKNSKCLCVNDTECTSALSPKPPRLQPEHSLDNIHVLPFLQESVLDFRHTSTAIRNREGLFIVCRALESGPESLHYTSVATPLLALGNAPLLSRLALLTFLSCCVEPLA